MLALKPRQHRGRLRIAIEDKASHRACVEPGGCGFVKERLQSPREPDWVIEVGKVARLVEKLQHAPGHPLVRRLGVRHGDDAVPGTPHDQRRHLGRQVQAV
jgi:hypothetical protein